MTQDSWLISTATHTLTYTAAHCNTHSNTIQDGWPTECVAHTTHTQTHAATPIATHKTTLRKSLGLTSTALLCNLAIPKIDIYIQVDHVYNQGSKVERERERERERGIYT